MDIVQEQSASLLTAMENPYVAVLSRKIRKLRKKMEKITKTEAAAQSGRVLDEDQLVLLSSKNSVDKAFQDLLELKKQLEDVAAKEGKESEHNEEQKGVDAVKSKKFTEISTQVELKGSEESKSNSAKVETFDKETHTIPLTTHSKGQQFSVDSNNSSTMTNTMTNTVLNSMPTITTPSIPTPIPVNVIPHGEIVPLDYLPFVEIAIKKVLKVLHVCQRYSTMTNNKLPTNVDFFGKTLLGQTFISGFQETLAASLRATGLYLNEELAGNFEVVRGITYQEMNEIIDDLAAELSGENGKVVPEIVEETIVEPAVTHSVSVTPTMPTVTHISAPLPPVPPAMEHTGIPQEYVEQIPEFNFFADHVVNSVAEDYLVNQNADFITQLTGEIVTNIVLSTQSEANKVTNHNKQSTTMNNTKNNRTQRRKRPDREQVVDYPIGNSSSTNNVTVSENQQLPAEVSHVAVEEQLMTVHDAASESQKEKKLFKKQNNKVKKTTITDTIPLTNTETKPVIERSKSEEISKTLKEKKRLKKLAAKVDSTDSKPMSYSKIAAESKVENTVNTDINSDHVVKPVRQPKKKLEKSTLVTNSDTTVKPTDSVATSHPEKPKHAPKLKKDIDDTVVVPAIAPVEISGEKESKPKFDRTARPKTVGKEFKPREFRTQNYDNSGDNKVISTERPKRDYDKPKREYKPREERTTTVDENGVPTVGKSYKPKPKKGQEQFTSQPVVDVPAGITGEDDWEQKQSKRTKQLLKNLDGKVPSPATQNKPKLFPVGSKAVNKPYQKPKPISG